jgi:hypothetical protein
MHARAACNCTLSEKNPQTLKPLPLADGTEAAESMHKHPTVHPGPSVLRIRTTLRIHKMKSKLGGRIGLGRGAGLNPWTRGSNFCGFWPFTSAHPHI